MLPEQVTVDPFPPFTSGATLPLRPITLVYGPNGVGKSRLIRTALRSACYLGEPLVELPANGVEPGEAGWNAERSLGKDPGLLVRTATFYAGLQPPRVLDFMKTAGEQHLVLNGRPVRDWGQGLRALLAAVVLADGVAQGGGLLYIGSPERHLHPDTQRDLVRHLCALTHLPSRPRFILETHSRIPMLAVQHQVAHGALRADDVALVWVDQETSGRSETTTIGLTPDGRLLDGWPRSALNTDLTLAREMLVATYPTPETQR